MVSQKLRGLALRVRERLATVFGGGHTLVLGFSGGDLKFGEDYPCPYRKLKIR